MGSYNEIRQRVYCVVADTESRCAPSSSSSQDRHEFSQKTWPREDAAVFTSQAGRQEFQKRQIGILQVTRNRRRRGADKFFAQDRTYAVSKRKIIAFQCLTLLFLSVCLATIRFLYGAATIEAVEQHFTIIRSKLPANKSIQFWECVATCVYFSNNNRGRLHAHTHALYGSATKQSLMSRVEVRVSIRGPSLWWCACLTRWWFCFLFFWGGRVNLLATNENVFLIHPPPVQLTTQSSSPGSRSVDVRIILLNSANFRRSHRRRVGVNNLLFYTTEFHEYNDDDDDRQQSS